MYEIGDGGLSAGAVAPVAIQHQQHWIVATLTNQEGKVPASESWPVSCMTFKHHRKRRIQIIVDESLL